MNIILKLTDNCNNNCRYCYDKINRNKFGNISPMVTDSILQLIRDEREIKIVFHGGEPLLYGIDNLKTLITNIKSQNNDAHLSVQTNSILLDEAFVDLFIENNISCSTSVDFSDDRISEPKLDKLRHYISLGLNIGVLSVITQKNINNMVDMYEHLVDAGIKSISFNTEYDTSNYIDAESHYEGYSKFYSYLYNLPNPIERNYITYLSRLVGIEANLQCSPENCRYNWLTVNPNGDIYPCDRPTMLTNHIGNLIDFKDLNSIWDSDGYSKYVNKTVQLQYTNCIDCKVKNLCRTGCFCNHDIQKNSVNTNECTYMFNYYKILNNLINGGNVC